MKKFLVFFLFVSLKISAQNLSPQAEFGLVTISPGSTNDAIYQIWGHTVLHLKDSVNNINECYDYGSFNFDQPNFIGKFLQGTLPYKMTIVDFDKLVNHYRDNEQRFATERILNLSAQQKGELYNFLVTNYLPENREYLYRFFYYNCASRLRDILHQVCKDSLVFDKDYNSKKSYRTWIHEYAKEKQPWTDFGMSLAIGLPADKNTMADGAMFLPENLAQGFEKAKIIINGKEEPFVKSKNILSQAPSPALSTSIFTPINVLLVFLVFMLVFTFFQIKNNNKNTVFDKIFFSVLGLIGWFIIGLWFFTDHGVTEYNMNIIWAFPLFLPAIFFLKTQKILKPFLIIYGVVNILLLASWAFLPQKIPSPVIPIILVALARVYFILKNKYEFNRNSK
jgi:Domain of unknown function (DUF4105)